MFQLQWVWAHISFLSSAPPIIGYESNSKCWEKYLRSLSQWQGHRVGGGKRVGTVRECTTVPKHGWNNSGNQLAVHVFSSNCTSSGNLLCFYIPILSHSSILTEVYSLLDGGASNKFITKALLQNLGGEIPLRTRGYMNLTTANTEKKVHVQLAQLTLDLSGYLYTSWFYVLDDLKNYHLILGKS